MLKRATWLAIGGVALALGAAGVLLPVLPTTPFVILAAFAFGKSAPGLATRIEQSQVFGPALVDWHANGAIAPRFKSVAIGMMAGAFFASIAMSASAVVLVVQAMCMIAAAAFILSRPSGPA